MNDSLLVKLESDGSDDIESNTFGVEEVSEVLMLVVLEDVVGLYLHKKSAGKNYANNYEDE